MGKSTNERRSVPRKPAPDALQARVRAFIPARIVDISTRGALMEVTQQLPPQSSCDVRISHEGDEILLSAIVRRCYLAGFHMNEEGENVVLYRAGLEFASSAGTPIEQLSKMLSPPQAPEKMLNGSTVRLENIGDGPGNVSNPSEATPAGGDARRKSRKRSSSRR